MGMRESQQANLNSDTCIKLLMTRLLFFHFRQVWWLSKKSIWITLFSIPREVDSIHMVVRFLKRISTHPKYTTSNKLSISPLIVCSAWFHLNSTLRSISVLIQPSVKISISKSMQLNKLPNLLLLSLLLELPQIRIVKIVRRNIWVGMNVWLVVLCHNTKFNIQMEERDVDLAQLNMDILLLDLDKVVHALQD